MNENRQRQRSADRLLVQTTRGGITWVLPLAIVSTVGAAAGTLLPAVLGRAVDATLAGPVAPGSWVLGCGALIGVIVACDALHELAAGSSTADATAWLRRRVVRHVLAAAPRLTPRFQAGDVVSRLTGGTTDAGGGPAAGVMAVTSLVPALGSPVALALIDPWLALAFGAGLPVLAIVLRTFVHDSSEAVASYQRAQGAIAARLLDALRGARTIAAAGTVERESERVLAPLNELRASGQATWRAIGRVSAQGTLVVPLLQVVVLAVGGLELARGRISPGQLLAASQYAVLGSGVGAIIAPLNRLARARAGAVRADELLAEAPTAYGTEAGARGRGRLEVRGVTVSREGRRVLDSLDLTVSAGSSVAIVGRSGSGKSTLAALAGRLVDPDQGEVLLDGVPLRSLTRPALRRAVQYAFERPALLGATLGAAIGFGATTPSRRQVESGARAACADAFIRRLPHGYDTALADAPLSGGEAQRIGLARAFSHARAARLMILDDATSSLDTATEMQVSRTVTDELRGRTRLIVAHRVATAARADLVAWLDQGRLMAYGPHDELWADPGYRAVFVTEEEDDYSPLPRPSPSGGEGGEAEVDDREPASA
jgi:ATP-binding cassette subfamily B protein